MKLISYAAASVLPAFLLLACPAAAQMPETREAAPAPAPASGAYDAGFQDGLRAAMAHMDAMVRERGGRGGTTDHMKMMEHMKRMHGVAGHEETAGEPEGGPRVKLVRGNAEIVLECAVDDSTEDCVNSAIVLLDHAAAEKREKAQEQPAAPPPPAGGPQTPQH